MISQAATPSVFRRMACWCYEGVLLFALIFIASYLFSSLSQTRHALENRHAQQAFLFLVLGIYFGWFWSRGQTLAMKTWHIRVVDREGLPLSQKRAVARYLLSWLWFLPPLAAVQIFQLDARFSLFLTVLWVCLWASLARLHQDRQFFHDVLAGTRLIDSKEDQAAARAQM
ncbi:MAG: RDD family protein [Betaproteobacteria bacterium]